MTGTKTSLNSRSTGGSSISTLSSQVSRDYMEDSGGKNVKDLVQRFVGLYGIVYYYHRNVLLSFGSNPLLLDFLNK
jgi:hypothetical protein